MTTAQSGSTLPYNIAKGPLDTPWTASVLEEPWPEYPRPQLRRSNWLNLNGVWQFETAKDAKALESPPFGKNLKE